MLINSLQSIFLTKINNGNPTITYSFSNCKVLAFSFHRTFLKVLCCIRIGMMMIVEITKMIVKTIDLFFKKRKKMNIS